MCPRGHGLVLEASRTKSSGLGLERKSSAEVLDHTSLAVTGGRYGFVTVIADVENLLASCELVRICFIKCNPPNNVCVKSFLRKPTITIILRNRGRERVIFSGFLFLSLRRR